jgi:HPt (histidine-containing phosphotransfer) domain-containing protein
MGNRLFDSAALAERLGPDGNVQREIIDLFLDVQPQKMNELAQAVARDDSHSARGIAHSLVGAFRSMSMPRLGDTAKMLERAATVHDLDLCRTLFLELDELFAHACNEVSDEPADWEHVGIRVEIMSTPN